MTDDRKTTDPLIWSSSTIPFFVPANLLNANEGNFANRLGRRKKEEEVVDREHKTLKLCDDLRWRMGQQ